MIKHIPSVSKVSRALAANAFAVLISHYHRAVVGYPVPASTTVAGGSTG